MFFSFCMWNCEPAGVWLVLMSCCIRSLSLYLRHFELNLNLPRSVFGGCSGYYDWPDSLKCVNFTKRFSTIGFQASFYRSQRILVLFVFPTFSIHIEHV